MSSYYNRVYVSCQLNTRVTPILQYIGPCNLFGSVLSMFVVEL